KVNLKIRDAQMQKIPYMLVVGDREQENGQVAVRNRKHGDEGAKPLAEFLSQIRGLIESKPAANGRSGGRRLAMYATAEGTARYEGRFPAHQKNAFFRSLLNLSVSSLGIGTYLGKPDDETDQAYTDALIAAAENGINVFDTAINYRN